MAFEYKILDIGGFDHPRLEATLNQLGRAGWELVSMLPPQSAIFMRASNASTSEKEAASSVAVKYRDPDTGETWSGRGRMATWLAQRVKAGARLDDFLV